MTKFHIIMLALVLPGASGLEGTFAGGAFGGGTGDLALQGAEGLFGERDQYDPQRTIAAMGIGGPTSVTDEILSSSARGLRSLPTGLGDDLLRAGDDLAPLADDAGKLLDDALEAALGGARRAAGGADDAARGALNPSTIRFSQSSIGRTFRSGGTLRETIAGLRSGAISAESIPAIRVFERGGRTFTLDNRRLFVFQEAGIPIRTVPATPKEIAAEAWKFTTTNEGASIIVRGGL